MFRASSGKTVARRLLIGAGAMALVIPLVAGCEAGEDAPTLEFHPANSGTNTEFNGIRIINAFVVAAPSGASLPAGSSAGLFVALFNENTGTDELISARAPGSASSVSLSSGSVALPPNQSANLTGPAPDLVLNDLTKPLAGGTTIQVTFDFAHAGSVTLPVPVEAKSFQWATFSPAPAAPTATATAAPTTTNTP